VLIPKNNFLEIMMAEDRKAFPYRSVFSSKFLFSAIILCIAATGMRPCLGYLANYYSKETIAINRPLKEFDISRLPSYREGWIRTYYSDPASKVPHTPDVCYRQAGTIVEKMENIEIDVPNLPSGDKQVKARLLMLKRPSGNQGVVIYSFCVEGLLRCAREQTRLVLGMPGNKYTYFSKVEVVSFLLPDVDPEATIVECKRLYAEAMALLLSEHFPTREQLKRR